MENIRIKSIKVATYFPLDKLVELFNIPTKSRSDEYITLSGSELDLVLKYNTKNKHVYIFKYGCISFANFEDEEIYIFIEYIKSIGSKINYTFLYKHFDIHTIKVLKNNKVELWENSAEYDYSDVLIDITSIVLAKSTELSRYEADLSMLLDDAEKFIVYLQKGRLALYRKKSCLLISKLLRFQYDNLHNIRIQDRPTFVEQSSEYRDIYDIMSNYYELDERLNVIRGKTGSFRDILDLYTNLSFNQTENRLLIFEIFLLALFPVFHLFEHFFKFESPISFLISFFK